MKGTLTVSTMLPIDGRKVKEETKVRITAEDDLHNLLFDVEVPLFEFALAVQAHRANVPADVKILDADAVRRAIEVEEAGR